jgi:hypothetical protein
MHRLASEIEAIFDAARRGDPGALAWSTADALRLATGSRAARVTLGGHEGRAGDAEAESDWQLVADDDVLRAEILDREMTAPGASDRALAVALQSTRDGWALYLEMQQARRVRLNARRAVHEMRNAINDMHLQFALLEVMSANPAIEGPVVRERAQRGAQALAVLIKAIEGLDKAIDGEDPTD